MTVFAISWKILKTSQKSNCSTDLFNLFNLFPTNLQYIYTETPPHHCHQLKNKTTYSDYQQPYVVCSTSPCRCFTHPPLLRFPPRVSRKRLLPIEQEHVRNFVLTEMFAFPIEIVWRSANSQIVANWFVTRRYWWDRLILHSMFAIISARWRTLFIIYVSFQRLW